LKKKIYFSSLGSTATASVKRRGHQFHPKNTGSRRSVIDADEAIRILRGEQPVQVEISKNISPTRATLQENVIKPDNHKQQTTTNDNTIIWDNSQSDTTRLSHTKLNDYDNQQSTAAIPIKSGQPALCDDISISKTESNELLSSTISSSSSSSTVSKKKKKNESGEGKKTKSSSEHKRRKTKLAQIDITKMVRPAVEGAASDDYRPHGDDEDPEADEWLKLRCTSERTEVVAEREQRRQRRCADYPGLAFGRSVFSSDTMMKFNIIRNELHNIVNTQIKRVGSNSVDFSKISNTLLS
jgi:tropomyosin 1